MAAGKGIRESPVRRGEDSSRNSLTSLMIFPPRWMVLLLTMSTMATPRLQRIPKEMQKPSPLMMAMIYRRGNPKQVQSHKGAFFPGTSRGFPSSVNSMLSSGFCFFSRTLSNQRRELSQGIYLLTGRRRLGLVILSLNCVRICWKKCCGFRAWRKTK